MGDNYLKKQAKNFKKRRDAGIQQIHIPPLFTRPEIFRTVYKAKPLANQRCEVGETLYAMRGDSATSVPLIRGHHRVAYLDGDNAADFRNTLSDPNTPIIPVTISSVSSLSGIADVVVRRQKNHE